MPGGKDTTPLHPVENVSWEEAIEALPRYGLQLPTEAQWEYAARGGTATPWFTGADRDSLRSPLAVNLADQAPARFGGEWPAISDWPELDDGWVAHCPVDTMRPNPYGLHSVHGNVRERCMDSYRSSAMLRALAFRAPAGRPVQDPVFLDDRAGGRICRGSCFSDSAGNGRSSYRGYFTPDYRHYGVGLRPVRRLAP